MTRILLACSGLVLILFLIIHLGGLLLAVTAPMTFELYASALHSASWLKIVELVLLVILFIHISLTLNKVIYNYQTGSSGTLSSRRKDRLAVLVARYQPISGIFLLFFLCIHLAQFRFPRPPEGSEVSTLHALLNSPATLIVYSLGSLSLFSHLFHGIESSQRSLGMLTAENASIIRTCGRSLSLLIGIGFVLISISLGWPYFNYS